MECSVKVSPFAEESGHVFKTCGLKRCPSKGTSNVFCDRLSWLNENMKNKGSRTFIKMSLLFSYLWLQTLFLLYEERHAVVTLCRSFTHMVWDGPVCGTHIIGAALDQAPVLGFSPLLPPTCSLPAFIHLGRELHCANNSSSLPLCNV